MEMPWDKAALQALRERRSEPSYIVYECYDYNENEGKKWTRSFRVDFLNTKNGQRTTESQIVDNESYLPGLVLFEEEVDELPYREHHYDRVTGRWLGMGVVEYLFDNQIKRN